MKNSTLAKIESIFDFNYPKLYLQLSNDGMLDVGEIGSNWHTEVYLKLKDNPPLLFHSNDFEVLGSTVVYEALEEITAADSIFAIKKDYNFIPFGQSGAGDYYCFFLNEADVANGIPTVLLYHDDDCAYYLAKNLQDFMFKAILEYTVQIDEYKAENETEFKDKIGSLLKTHLCYLSDSQQTALKELFSREMLDYDVTFKNGNKEARRGFLTDIECCQIVKQLAPYPKDGQSFKYSDSSF